MAVTSQDNITSYFGSRCGLGMTLGMIIIIKKNCSHMTCIIQSGYWSGRKSVMSRVRVRFGA